MPEPLNIFVSYSRRDKKWLAELQLHLAPLVRGGQVNLWDDTRIKAGAQWKKQIAQALEAADIAILLISHYFLASDFILDEELQPLLETAEEKGLVILPVIVGHSRFQQTPSLSRFQAVNDPDKPLSRLPKWKRNEIFVQLTERIDEALKHRRAQRADEKATPEERPEEAPRLEEARSVGEPEPEGSGSSEDQAEVAPPMVEEVAEEETEPVAEVEAPEAASPVEEGEFVKEEEAETEAAPEEAAHPPESVSETSEEQVAAEEAAAEEAAPAPEPESEKSLPAPEAEEEEPSPEVEREKAPSPVHRTDSAQIWKRAAKWMGSVGGLVVVVLVLIQFLPVLIQFLQPGSQGPATSPTFENDIGMAFMLIEAGDFEMGSDEGDSDEKPPHLVTISQPFYLGKYEVTQGQFQAFVEATGYRTEAEQGDGCYVFEGGSGTRKAGASWKNTFVGDDRPVVCVSWNDAQAFVEWLNAEEGDTLYRLPTEAEWEYAAKAGTDDRYAGTDSVDALCRYANVADASAKRENPDWTTVSCDDGYAGLAPVGKFQPNVWELHDMTGNVWEWVEDSYGDYPSRAVTDPTGPESGSCRVIRGGSWAAPAEYARSAYRATARRATATAASGFDS